MYHQDWSPVKISVIFVKHVEDKFVKRDKKCNLISGLHPVPTTHKDLKSKPSLLQTSDTAGKSPKKHKVEVNKLTSFEASEKLLDINSLSA